MPRPASVIISILLFMFIGLIPLYWLIEGRQDSSSRATYLAGLTGV